MATRPNLPSFAASLAGCLGLLVVGCQSPGTTRIVGPDGSPMAHVHCGFEQGACFRMAGELCPTGYDMKPVLSGNDGNFLVRCRATGAPLLAPYAATAATQTSPPSLSPPTAVASVPAQAPKDAWPPATEPPLMYPWPPPESSAAVRATPTTPTTPQGDVDIGY
jgi:hypothetical protein